MKSKDLVMIARQRAGITQQQLADRAGHPRESIARWETGAREPSLATLEGLVAACDLDLVVRLAPRDPSLRDLALDQLALSPPQRLHLLPSPARADCLRALRWVASARTPVVAVGAVAGVLQGEPQRPGDGHVEIVSSDPHSTDAELREGGLRPVDTDDRWAAVDRREPWTLPSGGTITLARDLPGADGYRDLRRNALPIELGRGRTVAAAHVRDLLRVADASARPNERARVPALDALLSLLNERT
jgi:transcriptional regulator with XRE-family HTH domain